METTKNPLVEALIQERLAQKLTQGQLAEASGLSRRALNLIEGGGDCTLSTLQRLLDTLGLEPVARRTRRMTLDDVVQESEEELFDKPAAPGG
ncbi:helix-turn-helix domain-containing protein [Polaromonas sp.]|uniref:helix-turn-helix domain-containing protein n=1 Tax=Polaromonas sp. TaxID=1869339 RepID=UPI00352A69AD